MILVTGGTGLVGSHLLVELSRKNEKIRAIHRPGSDTLRVLDTFRIYLENPEQNYHKVEWVPGDITDFDSLVSALDGIDYVYHAAADVSFSPGDRLRLLDNNIEGTANVVNACLEKNIRKLCYVSSTAALGEAPPGEEITEDMLWTNTKNRSLYSVSKFKSEMEVWRGIAEGLNAVIVNPSIIIGPGDWKRSSPYLFTAVWNGMKYYSLGVTGYVDIRDVVKAMTLLMAGDFLGERYTVSAENLSFRQVLDMIAHALGKKKPVIHATPFLTAIGWRLDWFISSLTGKSRMITRDAAKSSRRKVFFSNRKIREALGIEFIPVKKSIEETAIIFLETQPVKN
jgi:nucleoside-diphosphate-sugar epimerase